MHGIDLITQMDIFYHAMNYTSKGIIDASCCGCFKRRSAKEGRCHTPIPGPTRLADPNRVRGARPCTGTLYLIFFLFFKSRTGTCGYDPHLITKSKCNKHIKSTTTGVASIKIYTHLPSPIYIYNLNFYIYKSEHGTYM